MLQRLNLSKSTKIRANYIIGGIISIILLYAIYLQIHKQLVKLDTKALWQTGPSYFLWLAIFLMPVNLALESRKWQLLVNTAQPLSYKNAFFSYLTGIAFSIITPNRIGEYPGRLLYLRRRNTFRLVSVSVLGAVSQLLTLFIYGTLGLLYYCYIKPELTSFIVLASCIACTIGVYVVYWRFEKWAPFIEKIKWLRKYHVYGKMLHRFSNAEQRSILFISIIRYAVFTIQYMLLLHWLNVPVPAVEGFLMSALFFWVIAVIPTITLVELGERGIVGIYLFHHFSDNTVGILAATIAIWCVNLILPAITGSILLLRARILQ